MGEHRHCDLTDWRTNPRYPRPRLHIRGQFRPVAQYVYAGASLIMVTGTTRDAARLDLAKGSGAGVVIDCRARIRSRGCWNPPAIRALAGETGEDAIHISLLPWKEKT